MNDYISDLSLIIVDLKEIVYGMLDIKINPFNNSQNYHKYNC